jgi:hypothetical protein
MIHDCAELFAGKDRTSVSPLAWERHGIEEENNDALKSSAHLFAVLARGSNTLFQELFGRTNGFQLLETPLEQYRPEIG